MKKEKWSSLGFWAVVGFMMFAAWAIGFAQPGLQDLGIVIFLIVILFPLFRFLAFPATQFVVTKLYRGSTIASERHLVPFVRGVRAQAESLFIFHGYTPYRGLQEPDLKRRILSWRDASIDSCYYALAILNRVQDERVVESCRSTLLDFLVSNFVPANSQKCPGLFAFRQAAGVGPTVYASHMAVNVLKLLEGMDAYGSPLGYRKAVEIFGPRGIDVEKLVGFVRKSQDNDSGGFYDYPNALDQLAGIQTSHSACCFLWNLDRLELVAKSLCDFVFRLLPEEQKMSDNLGFSDRPGGMALSCSTYYALRVLEKLGERAWIEENKKRLAHFLELCWHERGGFGASPSGRRSLIHTALAIATLLDILKDPSFLSQGDRLKKLVSYIEGCKDRHDGFKFWSGAFGLGGHWYSANLYATSHVVESVRLLGTIDPDCAQLLNKKAIGSFVRSTAITSLEGGDGCVWRGYWIGDTRAEIAVSKLFRKLLDALLMPRDFPKYCG